MILRFFIAAYAFCAPVSALAAGEGSIRYDFLTVLVPDEGSSAERTIERNDPWFTGKAFPRRVVRTLNEAIIPQQVITLPAGTLLGLAESEKPIGCAFDSAIKFRLGQSRVCLIDMDRDGQFDHWFRRGGGMIFYAYSSKISLDDIFPIAPVGAEIVSDWKSIPDGTHFQARFWWNELRACTGEPKYELTMQCTTKGAAVLRDGAEHQTSFLRGVFRYRYADKKFIIQTVKPPEASIGLGENSANGGSE